MIRTVLNNSTCTTRTVHSARQLSIISVEIIITILLILIMIIAACRCRSRAVCRPKAGGAAALLSMSTHRAMVHGSPPGTVIAPSRALQRPRDCLTPRTPESIRPAHDSFAIAAGGVALYCIQQSSLSLVS